MINLITENMDIWTSAQLPKTNGGGRGNGSSNQNQYGIKKLRELILELAVRGKLVPQDPSDEPASVLLERIAKEKARLIKEGKIKKQKPLPEITDEAKPYYLPSGWEWERLGNLFDIQDSRRIPVNSVERASRNGPYPYYGANGQVGSIDDYLFEGERILVAEDGGFFDDPIRGVAYVVDGKFWVNNHAHVLECLCETNARYWIAYLNNLNWVPLVRGMTRDKLNQAAMVRIVMAVPPLEEQYRIAAKVDELTVLCDQLEQKQSDSDAAHQTLVETLLSALAAAANQGEFADTWQRISEHFDILFTTDHSIDQLKKTILQLAVMGKLVPQDPNDESLQVLIPMIEDERRRRAINGKPINSQISLDSEEGDFQLPQSWSWVKLGFAVNIIMGQSPPGETYNTRGEGVPLINGPVEFSEGPFGITIVNQYTTKPTKLCKKGDLLLCVRGSTTGRTNIAGFDACIGRGVAALQSLYDDRFIRLFVWSWRDKFLEIGRGIAFPSISRQQIEDLAVPFPPLPEQHRIVAKVDELIAVCDTLKEQLRAAQTTQVQLADAVVEQAVA